MSTKEQSALTSDDKKKRVQRAFLCAALIGAAFLFEITPVNGVILCPFRRLTGFSCPGCGMTRSCVALVHGDLYLSLTEHPFGVVFLTIFVTWALVGIWEWMRGYRFEALYNNLTQRLFFISGIAAIIFLMILWSVRFMAEVLTRL